jgi:hypothetical protein
MPEMVIRISVFRGTLQESRQSCRNLDGGCGVIYLRGGSTIKPARRLPCVTIGWQPGVCGLRSLLVAAPWAGQLRYVANVRTGFTDLDRRRLVALLQRRQRARPVVR